MAAASDAPGGQFPPWRRAVKNTSVCLCVAEKTSQRSCENGRKRRIVGAWSPSSQHHILFPRQQISTFTFLTQSSHRESNTKVLRLVLIISDQPWVFFFKVQSCLIPVDLDISVHILWNLKSCQFNGNTSLWESFPLGEKKKTCTISGWFLGQAHTFWSCTWLPGNLIKASQTPPNKINLQNQYTGVQQSSLSYWLSYLTTPFVYVMIT